MNTRGTRRLGGGREVDIGRNDGLRKVCRCGRNKWTKCPHSWHFSFQWGGQHHRFSLERHIGKKLTKSEAEVEAERLRTAIRAGEFQDLTTGSSAKAAATSTHDVSAICRRMECAARVSAGSPA
jgi:hypothetical protein